MDFDQKPQIDTASLEEDKQRNPQASKYFSVSTMSGFGMRWARTY